MVFLLPDRLTKAVFCLTETGGLSMKEPFQSLIKTTLNNLVYKNESKIKFSFIFLSLILTSCSNEPTIDWKTINWKTASKEEVKKGINEQNVNSTMKVENPDGSYKEFTPLEIALSEGANLEVIEALLRKKADVNFKTKFKNLDGSVEEKNAMALALEKNASPELVQMLFRFGALPGEILKKEKLDGKEEKIPVIYYAAKYNTHEQVMKDFIYNFKEGNEEILSETRRHLNPVFGAASYNKNEAVLDVLYNFTNYINKGYYEKLPQAVRNVRLSSMKNVQEKIRDICKYVGGLSPCTIHYAAWYNSNPKVVDTILNYSSKGLRDRISEGKEIKDFSPTDLAIQFNKNADVVKAIINAAHPEEKAAGDGLTPLMRAAKYSNDPEVITALIEQGHDVNKFKKERIMVEKTVDRGAGPMTLEQSLDTKIYPIMLALENDEPKIFETLLENGAILDEK